MMLFRKQIPRACEYCAYGAKLGEEEILCAKKGVVSPASKCRKFQYDPCKRIPPRPKAPNFNKYKEEDFSL